MLKYIDFAIRACVYKQVSVLYDNQTIVVNKVLFHILQICNCRDKSAKDVIDKGKMSEYHWPLFHCNLYCPPDTSKYPRETLEYMILQRYIAWGSWKTTCGMLSLVLPTTWSSSSYIYTGMLWLILLVWLFYLSICIYSF